MNPIKVHKIIKESKNNGERITIDMLSQRCSGRVRHRYVKMSDELFECEECGGFPRHWVERLRLHSWLSLLFYNPQKVEISTSENKTAQSLEEAQDMGEYLNKNDNDDNK